MDRISKGKSVRDVVWSEAALDDTDLILAYIAADNANAARKVLDRIESTAVALVARPSAAEVA